MGPSRGPTGQQVKAGVGGRQARGGWAAAWLVRGRAGPEALAAHAARERGGERELGRGRMGRPREEEIPFSFYKHDF